MLPVYTLRRKGGVPQGESYVKTTRLVDTGIYAIARHPQQGAAWLLINLGVMLVAQHWLIAVLGLASLPLVYLDTLKTDQYEIEKFGEAYRHYMARVPRVNFVAGIFRLLVRGRG
jgi:protein-S-isoprenylcysteine O-methyltransferase Ste14